MKRLLLVGLILASALGVSGQKKKVAPYCATDAKPPAVHCNCANQYDEDGNVVGDACAADEPLPISCAKICKDAKDCHCCAAHHIRITIPYDD